jgi:hypothetical protein
VPIIERERAVHRTAIELTEQVAKPIDAPLELTEGGPLGWSNRAPHVTLRRLSGFSREQRQ